MNFLKINKDIFNKHINKNINLLSNFNQLKLLGNYYIFEENMLDKIIQEFFIKNEIEELVLFSNELNDDEYAQNLDQSLKYFLENDFSNFQKNFNKVIKEQIFNFNMDILENNQKLELLKNQNLHLSHKNEEIQKNKNEKIKYINLNFLAFKDKYQIKHNKSIIESNNKKILRLIENNKERQGDIVNINEHVFTLLMCEEEDFKNIFTNSKNKYIFAKCLSLEYLIKIREYDQNLNNKIKFLESNLISSILEEIENINISDEEKFREIAKRLSPISLYSNKLNVDISELYDYLNQKEKKYPLEITKTIDKKENQAVFSLEINKRYSIIKLLAKTFQDEQNAILMPLIFFLEDSGYSDVKAMIIKKNKEEQINIKNNVNNSEDYSFYDYEFHNMNDDNKIKDEIESVRVIVNLNEVDKIQNIFNTVNACLCNILNGKYSHIDVEEDEFFIDKASSKEYRLLKLFFREVSLREDLIEKNNSANKSRRKI